MEGEKSLFQSICRLGPVVVLMGAAFLGCKDGEAAAISAALDVQKAQEDACLVVASSMKYSDPASVRIGDECDIADLGCVDEVVDQVSHDFAAKDYLDKNCKQ